MRGRVCLVTGATLGIGRATAVGLARQGARVGIVGRSRERGEAVRAEIAREAGASAVELFLGDLSSQAEVRRIAGEVRARFGRLDVLVSNAGVYTRRRESTVDGIETQLAVNHLAPFLLTRLLLDLLTASAPARVVVVSSEAHRGARIPWDDLQGERKYSGLRAYANTKLMNLLFVRELARRTAGTGVTVNALHPGVVATELLFGGWAPLRLLRPFLRTPEQGASTSVWLASSAEVEGVTGRYFRDEREVVPSRAALDDEAARRLWKISEELTGLSSSS
ncbi:MAG: SDR family oxidoreductase [Gemmatimonadetes bacterium]|nr:SDR family oxidoreductase [Gemmatimonadota bacterium]